MDENDNVSTLEFEFYPHCEGYADIDVRFGVSPDISLHQFHRLCKLFALTMGYPESSVEETFGEDCWE